MKLRNLTFIIPLAVAPALVFSAAAQTEEEKTVAEARAAMEAFYVAFNRADNEALQEYMNFPHVFLSRNGRVSISEERWELNFERMREREA